MAALGSGFISCTVLDKTLGVRPPDTLVAESPSMVAPGAYLGKLFLVLMNLLIHKRFCLYLVICELFSKLCPMQFTSLFIILFYFVSNFSSEIGLVILSV